MALINTTTTGILGTTVYGDGAGALTVQKDGVTQGVYGKIPACRAYRGTAIQTFSTGTWTKIAINAIDFDTDNSFDTTNNWFKPTVAGYYSIGLTVNFTEATSSGGYDYIAIRKNGNFYVYGASARVASQQVQSDTTLNCSTLMYLNGTTDYADTAVYQDSGATPAVNYGTLRTQITAVLVKAA